MARALEVGAAAGLKRTFLDEIDFITALRARSEDLANISPAAACLLHALCRSVETKRANSASAPAALFTEQELRVLDLVARGRSNKCAAQLLDLSVNTVKWHLSHLYSKLGAHSREQAVAIARERGLVE